MTRGEALLRPVNPAFIAISLASALMLNALPWGRNPWVPDFLAVTLVFWNVHQPRRVGIGIAWLMGLLMDVHNASVLGEHALAYSLLSYGAISLHRRVPWFTLMTQALHVLPLFLLAQVVVTVVRMAVGAPFAGWLWFAQSLTDAALWPIAHWLLLAPQRRPADDDEPASR